MKKPLFAALLVSPVFLAACFDTEADVEVKDDGSVKIHSEAVMSRSVYNMFTKAAGEDYIRQRCEIGGGEFHGGIAHVACKVSVDTTLDALMAGDAQNKMNHQPLDLSGLTLMDNGDGTYTMDYQLDWELVGEATETPEADAAVDAEEDAAKDAEKVEDQAEKVEDEAEKDEEKAEEKAEKDAEKDQEEMDKQSEDIAKSADADEDKIRKYLDGHKVTIKFKAPHIISGTGDVSSNAKEITMEVDLGQAAYPLDFEAVFSTQKQ